MYVALTRAKDVLSLYAPLRYHHTRARSDRHSYAPVSRFVSPLRHHFAESSDGADPADPAGSIDLATTVSVVDEVDLSTQRLWTL